MQDVSIRGSAAIDHARFDQMKDLLGRHPSTTEEENVELSTCLRKGPMLGRALLSGVPEIQSKLKHFTADRPREFSFTIRDYLVAALIGIATLDGGYLLWDVAF